MAVIVGTGAALFLTAYIRVRIVGHRRRVVKVTDPDGEAHWRIEMPIRIWEWAGVEHYSNLSPRHYTLEKVVEIAKRLSTEARKPGLEEKFGTFDGDRQVIKDDGDPDPYTMPR
jgi:hypothetical protein